MYILSLHINNTVTCKSYISDITLTCWGFPIPVPSADTRHSDRPLVHVLRKHVTWITPKHTVYPSISWPLGACLLVVGNGQGPSLTFWSCSVRWMNEWKKETLLHKKFKLMFIKYIIIIYSAAYVKNMQKSSSPVKFSLKKNDLPSTLTWTEHCAVFPEESVAVIRVVFTVPMSATVSRSTPVSEDVLDPCSTLLTKLLTKSRGSRVTMAASSGMRTVLDGLQDSKGGISSVIPTESEQLSGLPRVYIQFHCIQKYLT